MTSVPFTVVLFLLKSTDAKDYLAELPEANKMVSCNKYWDLVSFTKNLANLFADR